MTQQEITNARADLAVRKAAVEIEVNSIDANIAVLMKERDTLAFKESRIIMERAQLLRLENEMRRAGEWK